MISEIVPVIVDLFVSTQFSFKPHVREDLMNYCKIRAQVCDDFDEFYNQLFCRYLMLDGPDSVLCMKLINHLSKNKWLFT